MEYKSGENILNEIQENTKWHNPYDQELREQESIERGDIDALKRCWNEKYDGAIGTLALDPLRHAKNLAVGVITLSSRSAVRGGLNYETVFSIVDATILKIEHQMTEPEQVIEAIHAAQLLFTQMVKENKGAGHYNPIVSKAKDYIFKNIHGKISVSDMACRLGVNPDYLSHVFRQCENKTVTQYILDEKLKLCCNMLKYSDYGISGICAYFGFCSQSYFTKQFKKSLGITPSKYRDKYGKK
ncbi:MAG: AraC family transcriptional regulator [Firmicutes bacterium]|nr:AraC family transcriptional regulator [Bacillota bacterium]